MTAAARDLIVTSPTSSTSNTSKRVVARLESYDSSMPPSWQSGIFAVSKSPHCAPLGQSPLGTCCRRWEPRQRRRTVLPNYSSRDRISLLHSHTLLRLNGPSPCPSVSPCNTFFHSRGSFNASSPPCLPLTLSPLRELTMSRV